MATRVSWCEAVRAHWPEYLMEAGLLGTFMIVAAVVGSILEYPGSALHQAVPAPFQRHVIGGVLMGLTAMGLVHSPWGRQSGAHMNPSLTLAFLRLGKVARWDAVFYVTAQVVGGCAGILVASALIGSVLAHPSVNYIATVPGMPGALVAWLAEAAISFVLMLTVLTTSNTARLSRLTPLFAGMLIATYITFESPLSGMSMNPARSLGPAVLADAWRSLWVYFTGPPIGMLLAAEFFVRFRGTHAVWCAKLHHDNSKRCIFRCTRPAQQPPSSAASSFYIGDRDPESPSATRPGGPAREQPHPCSAPKALVTRVAPAARMGGPARGRD